MVHAALSAQGTLDPSLTLIDGDGKSIAESDRRGSGHVETVAQRIDNEAFLRVAARRADSRAGVRYRLLVRQLPGDDWEHPGMRRTKCPRSWQGFIAPAGDIDGCVVQGHEGVLTATLTARTLGAFRLRLVETAGDKDVRVLMERQADGERMRLVTSVASSKTYRLEVAGDHVGRVAPSPYRVTVHVGPSGEQRNRTDGGL